MGPVNSTGVYTDRKRALGVPLVQFRREGVGWVKACVSSLKQATFELIASLG